MLDAPVQNWRASHLRAWANEWCVDVSWDRERGAVAFMPWGIKVQITLWCEEQLGPENPFSSMSWRISHHCVLFSDYEMALQFYLTFHR